MAASKSLEFVIRQDCLPLRDCMLTVTDVNGEAGFLYFKDAELIEANYAALWGKEALAQVSNWDLSEHTVAPLPLGIKRSLWDPLDQLLNPHAPGAATGVLPSASRRFSTTSLKRVTAKSSLDKYKKIQGLYRIVSIQDGKGAVVFDSAAKNDINEDITWLNEYVGRVGIIGSSLGFGFSSGWSIETDKYQVYGITQNDSFLVLMRRTDAGFDDLDYDVKQALAGEPSA